MCSSQCPRDGRLRAPLVDLAGQGAYFRLFKAQEDIATRREVMVG